MMYKTLFGNACEYQEGDDQAWDVDAREWIPVELVEFSEPIREVE